MQLFQSSYTILQFDFSAALSVFFILAILGVHSDYCIDYVIQFFTTSGPHRTVPSHMVFPLPLMPFLTLRTPYPETSEVAVASGLPLTHLGISSSVNPEHLVRPYWGAPRTAWCIGIGLSPFPTMLPAT